MTIIEIILFATLGISWSCSSVAQDAIRGCYEDDEIDNARGEETAPAPAPAAGLPLLPCPPIIRMM